MGLFSKNQTTTQTNQPSKQALQAYQGIANILTSAAAKPLQQYGGPRVAGFTPDQQAGFQGVQNAQGAGIPYLNAASQYASQGAAPITSIPQVGSQQFSQAGLSQFYNPYQQSVIDATMANINRNNAVQQNQLVGNAIASGASPFGGDRAGVAAAELARNQALASNQTMADLASQGYNTALGAFQNQQGLNQQASAQNASNYLNTSQFNNQSAANAANQFANFGNQAQQQALTGASALLQTGGLQQQLAQNQLDVPYQNFQQQQAYPMQQAQWLTSLLSGAQPNLGGTTSSTQPGPSGLSQAAGLGMGILGLGTNTVGAGLLGLRRGGIADFDAGGTTEPPNPAAVGAQGWTELPEPQSAGPAPQAGIGSFSFMPAAGRGDIAIPQMNAASMIPAGMGAQSYPEATNAASAVTSTLPDYLNALPQINFKQFTPIKTGWGSKAFGTPGLIGAIRKFPGLIDVNAKQPSAGVSGGFKRGGLPDYDVGGGADAGVSEDPSQRPFGGIDLGIGTAGLKAPTPAGLADIDPNKGVREVVSASPPADPEAAKSADPHPKIVDDGKNQMLVYNGGAESIPGLPSPSRSGTKWDKFLQSPNAAMVQAGLATMAGQSPFPLVNIGQGLQQGLQAWQNQRLMNQKLAMEQQQLLMGNVKQDAAGNLVAVRPTGDPSNPYKVVYLTGGDGGNPFGAGAAPAGVPSAGPPAGASGALPPPAGGAGPPSMAGAPAPSAGNWDDNAERAAYGQLWSSTSNVKPTEDISAYRAFLQQQFARKVPADQVPDIAEFKRQIKPPDVALTGESELNKLKAKDVGDYIDAGKAARARLQYANLMQDALNRGGDNIWTGAGADFVRTVKTALSNAGIDVAGMGETDVLSKGSILLATEGTKALSSRPSQFEFQKNIEANPGLVMSKPGSQLMLSIIRQQAQADFDLATLARHVKDPTDWADVVDKYYAEHPLMSPWDPKKPLTDEVAEQALGVKAGQGQPSDAEPPPAGVSPDEWKYLTPDERRLFQQKGNGSSGAPAAPPAPPAPALVPQPPVPQFAPPAKHHLDDPGGMMWNYGNG
jgi:hypothetical protein